MVSSRSTLKVIRSIKDNTKTEEKETDKKNARKLNFRATSNLSLDTQLKLAAATHASGSRFIEKIQHLKDFSNKSRKQAMDTRDKFDWLRQRSTLKKHEEELVKEIEAILLRIINHSFHNEPQYYCQLKQPQLNHPEEPQPPYQKKQMLDHPEEVQLYQQPFSHPDEQQDHHPNQELQIDKDHVNSHLPLSKQVDVSKERVFRDSNVFNGVFTFDHSIDYHFGKTNSILYDDDDNAKNKKIRITSFGKEEKNKLGFSINEEIFKETNQDVLIQELPTMDVVDDKDNHKDTEIVTPENATEENATAEIATAENATEENATEIATPENVTEIVTEENATAEIATAENVTAENATENEDENNSDNDTESDTKSDPENEDTENITVNVTENVTEKVTEKDKDKDTESDSDNLLFDVTTTTTTTTTTSTSTSTFTTTSTELESVECTSKNSGFINLSCPIQLGQELEDLLKEEQDRRCFNQKIILSYRDQIDSMQKVLMNVLEIRSKFEHQRNSSSVQPSTKDVDSNVGDFPNWFCSIKENLSQLILDALLGHAEIQDQLEQEEERIEKECREVCHEVFQILDETKKKNKWSEDVDRLVQSLGGDACPDMFLIQEIKSRFDILQQHHQEELERIEKEFCEKAKIPNVHFRLDGWDKKDQDRFLKAFKESHTSRRKVYFEKLQLALPHISMEKLEEYDTWFQARRFFLLKQNDIQTTHERTMKEEIENSSHLISQSIQAKEELQVREEEWKKRYKDNQILHERLAKLKEEKEKRDVIQFQLQQIKKHEEKEFEDKRNEKRKEEQATKKILVEEYKNQVALKKLEKEVEIDAQKEQEEREKVGMAVHNSKRVQFRSQERQNREEKHRRQQLLERIVKETPYATTIANITTNPERTRKPTATFSASLQSGQPVHEIGLFPTFGYDVDTLFKDARFKLGIALRDAGVHNSQYARQAMQKLEQKNSTAHKIYTTTAPLW